MTDTNSRQAAPATGRRRPSLYRTVLSLAVAALVAAWLPFAALYVTAVNSRPTTPTVLSTPQSSTGATRVITTTSGATRVVRTPGSAAATVAAAPTPVVTRVS